MSDLISRRAIMKEFADFVRKSNNSDFAPTPTWNDAVSLVGSIPSVQPQACDDVISRDDAIMAVKTGALSAATLFGRTDEGATAYYETVKAIKALPSAQPERWIPCSERLPSKGEYVLTMLEYKYAKHMGIMKRVNDYPKGEVWEDDFGYSVCDERVPAWMPLPEPYGGESE